ncbi:hypothetical protein [Streptomyces sp.]|uniref:hypothetical protein n=1 Tax=Streptomyces sp. TaxID=1931 RepID=UPI002F3E4675
MSRRTSEGRGRPAPTTSAPLVLSGGDGVHIVHAKGELPALLTDAADSLRDGPAGQATVLVGAGLGDGDHDELCELLTPVLADCRRTGAGPVLLVMSTGAAEWPGRPSPARRICEEWGVDVLAPSGVAVVVPGGTVFALDGPDTTGDWWLFSPGLVPQRLGARHPAPAWQGPLERVGPDIAEGHVVAQVPAGLLVQPAGARPEDIDAIRYAVPADPDRPLVLVGVPGSPPVTAEALANVIAALPGQIRKEVRLLPGDGRDLLTVGQEVADLLGLEVQVVNGLPVILEGQAARSESPRVRLVGSDGMPSWQPYVMTVTCVPADTGRSPAPRLGDWRLPVVGLREGPEPGVLLLNKRWQLTLTRAGLWVGPRGGRPSAVSDRVVDVDVMAIDLGVPGRGLDDSLWPVLDSLFGALEDEVRDRAMIQVHGTVTADGMKTLRRLAVRHGLALAPKGWRAGPPEPAAGPVSSAPVTAAPSAPAQAAPAQRPAAAEQARPAAVAPSRPAATRDDPSAVPARPTVTPPAPAGADVSAPSHASAPQRTDTAAVRPPVRITTTAAQGTGGAGSWSPPPAGRQTAPPATAEAAAPTTPASTPRATNAGTTSPRATEPPLAPPSATTEAEAPRITEAPNPGPETTPLWATTETEAPHTTETPNPSPETTPLWATTETEPPDVTEAPRSPTEFGQLRAGTDTAPRPAVEPAPDGPAFERTATGEPPVAETSEPLDPEPAPIPPPAARLFATATDGGFGGGGGAARSSTVPQGAGTPDTPSAPSAEPEPRPPVPEPEAEASPGGTRREAAYIPVRPSHRSSADERAALRSYLGGQWDQHAGAVNRALTRFPGLRTSEQSDEMAADLAAVHAYLDAGEGPLSDDPLRAAVGRRESDALSFLSCLASGLRRLPSFRGAAVRAAGVFGEEIGLLLPGAELGEATPVSALALDKTYPAVPADHYLIWSVTGRRASSLTDAGNHDDEEVVFGPGTRFRVLQVRERAGATVVLLRELTEAMPVTANAGLDDSDVPVLSRLRAAADQPTATGTGDGWPQRSTGALRVLTEPPRRNAP